MRSARSERRVGVRGARLAILMFVIIASTLTGPAPSSAQDAETPEPSSSPALAALAESVPSDLFTRPPDPLNLTSVTAEDHATSKVIGPKGGTLKTTGPDGTRFTLKIPKNVLPMAIEVTMTPLADLTGFPADATPEHHVGVQIEPDGLELAVPATLTIRPKGGFPEIGVVAMDYKSDGDEAGLHLNEVDRKQMVISVDHFSGYTAEFQLEIENIRRFAEASRGRKSPGDVLAAEIAGRIAQERWKQLTGAEYLLTNLELAEYYLPRFVEVVLTPAIAAAGRGCAEAQAAMDAILSYQRQRQNLGVGSDPAFDIKGGTTIPARLADLAVRLCFREAFQECVETGNFPWLMATYFSAFKQSELLLGVKPTAEHIELAHGYLRRCGRWRLEATAHQIGEADFEAKLDFELEWRPGEDVEVDWALRDSKIEGSGEQAISPIPLVNDRRTCPGERDKRWRLSELSPNPSASAAIEHLAFVRIRGQSLREGTKLPAEPRKLHLRLTFGLVDGRTNCRDGHDSFNSELPVLMFWWVYKVMDDRGAEVSGRGGELVTREQLQLRALEKAGWTFTTSPFKAVKHYSGKAPGAKPHVFPTADHSDEPHDVEMDLTLTHTPG